MTEALGAASEIANLIDFIPQLSRKIVQWRRASKLTPKSLNNLHREIASAIGVFSDAQNVLGYDPSTSNVDDPLWSTFNDTVKELDRLRCTCEDLQKDCSKFRFRLHPSILKEESQTLVEEVRNTVERLQSLHQSLKAPVASSRQAGYKVVFSVPVNPTNVYLDFLSRKSDGKPATFEGALMEKILSPSSHRTVGAVAVRGMGGVGKTVAMRGVALLPEAKRRFRGGIFFTAIGAVGGLSDLKVALSRMVRRAGGRQEADDIQAENDFSQAIEIAAEWFCHSPCLFIFDDVWFQNGIDAASLQVLFGVARHRESRLAFTSRDRRVSTLCSEAVVFESREQNGIESVNILLQSANVPRVPSSTQGEDVFYGILKECNGLPLALSLAGAAVRSFGPRVSDVDGRWLAYREKWSTFIEEVEVSVQRKELMKSVMFSLKLVSADISARRLKNDIDVFYLFKSLSIFQKQRPVPAQVLRRHWSVSKVVVEAVLSTLECYSVVQSDMSDHGTIEYVAIHDMVLDIAKDLCEKGEISVHSKNLLMSYIIMEGNSGSCGERELDVVSLMGVDDDGFILLNMCTLLQQSGMVEVICGLVADPLWIVKQMHTNGYDQVQNDIQLCLQCLRDGDMSEGQREKDSFVSFLRATSLAVGRMAKDVVSSSWEGMAWFQLYGRLQAHAEKNRFTDTLIEDVKCKAPRPWVQPSTGCLPSSSISMAHVIRLQDCNAVLCFQRFGKSLYVCHKNEDSLVISSFDWESMTAGSTYSVELEAFGGCVECGCFYDQDIVILGLDNGYVIILSRQTARTSSNDVLNGESKGTNSGKQDHTRKHANIGSEHSHHFKECGHNFISCLKSFKKAVQGTTRNMDAVETRDSNGREEITPDKNAETILTADGVEWHLVKLQGHTECVTTVFVSCLNQRHMVVSQMDDTKINPGFNGQEEWMTKKISGQDELWRTVAGVGKRVLSGSNDKTVRVWEKCEAGWSSQMLSGHEDLVKTVAMTDDGMRVVSGSNDQTVRLWTKEEGGWSSHVLSGHGDSILTVAITADGRQVVSSSADGTVRVWKEEEEGWSKESLLWHDQCVMTVAIVDDGGLVVCGCDDKTVRVWEKEHDGWWSQTLSGHEDSVLTVTVTDDGRRVMSGSNDKTVRVWEKGEEGWASQVLSGHEDWVTTVAVTDDGSHVVCGSDDKTVRVWEKGKQGWSFQVLSGHESSVETVTVTADGSRVVSCSDDNTVRVWEECEGAWSSEVLSGHEDSVNIVTVTDNGRWLVSGSNDKTVRLWEKGIDGWSSHVLSGHEDWITTVTVTEDGRRVVSGSNDKMVRVWEKEEGWSSYVLSGHGDCISAVVITQNGNRVVSVSRDHTVRVWDRGIDRWSSQTLSGHTYWVWAVAVSADGRRIASGSDDRTVRVWEEGEEGWSSQLLSGHGSGIRTVAMTDDGDQIVSGSTDKTVRLWEKGKAGWSSQTFSGHGKWILSVAVRDDGTRIVSGSNDKTVRVWEKREDAWSSQTFSGHDMPVRFGTVSHDGRQVVCGSHGAIVLLWTKGKQGWSSQTLSQSWNEEKSIALSADGRRVVSGSGSRTVRVWEKEGEEWSSQMLIGHEDSVNAVAISKDGTSLVSGSRDSTVRVWKKREEIWWSQVLAGHEDCVWAIAVTDDGRRVVSGSYDKTVRVWDEVEDGWSSQVLSGHGDWLRAVSVTGDGMQVVSGSDDKMVRVWREGREGWSSQVLSGHEDWVTTVATTDDGKRVVSGSRDDTVLVWEEDEEGWSSQILSGHEDSVCTVAITDNGRRVVSGSCDKTVQVWEKGQECWSSQVLAGHEGWVWAVTVMNDGRRILSGSNDKTVRLWEKSEEGWSSRVLLLRSCVVETVAVSNSGRLVVLGADDKTVRVWEKSEEGWSSHVLPGHDACVRIVAVTDDGSRVVSGSDDNMVRVWDRGEEGWSSQVLSGHADSVKTAAISEDGRFVVSGSDDQMVRLWEEDKEGWSLQTLSGHEGLVFTVSVSDDGTRVVSGSNDETVRVWEKVEGEWQQYCIQLGREFCDVTFLGIDKIEYTLDSGQCGYLVRDSTSWKLKQWSGISEPNRLAGGKWIEKKSNSVPFAVWEELFTNIGAHDWMMTASGFFCLLRDKPLVGQLDVLT